MTAAGVHTEPPVRLCGRLSREANGRNLDDSQRIVNLTISFVHRISETNQDSAERS